MEAGPKPCGYYNRVRTEILPLLPDRFDRLLDVGCGEGATARYLKSNGYCDWAAGIEISPRAAAMAQTHLDLVIETDIETSMPDLPPVDVILCLDMLEHLVDPWRCIDRLRSSLRPGGMIVASIPNVRNFRVTLPLALLGRWDYVDEGILDNTHLRFFTRRSAVALLQRQDLIVDRVVPHYGRHVRTVSRLTLGLFADLLCKQFLIRAKASPR